MTNGNIKLKSPKNAPEKIPGLVVTAFPMGTSFENPKLSAAQGR